MDVNTDGAPKSYHPQDPRGKSLAFNNMANAMDGIFDKMGKNANCGEKQGKCFSLYISTFEQSRDANYKPKGHPTFTTKDMIPWRLDDALGYKVPCTAPSGYFISQTALNVDTHKDVCDQSRYLDSTKFKAVVLPGDVVWKSQGVRTDKGDLVVVRDLETGEIDFAINGDSGPPAGIGEGSMLLAADLSNVTMTGEETYEQVKAWVRPSVQYLTFPKDDIRSTNKSFSQTDIDREAKKVFDEWGGEERLKACASLD
jgi:ABC-type molybdate transport system substrate-binding protein